MTAGQLTLIEASALAHAASDTTELARIKLEVALSNSSGELNTVSVRRAITVLRRIEAELTEMRDALNAGALS